MNTLDWSFENWITVGLMGFIFFWLFHFVVGQIKSASDAD